MTGAVLDVGVAVRTVDVPVGTAMAGFAARTGPSVGVHDPLSIRALAIGTTALVVVDCCAMHEDTCGVIRGAVTAAVPGAEVVVAATHTHSGPCIARGRLGPDQPELTRAVAAGAQTAAVAALGTRTACSVAYGEARGVGVARDRRHLDRSIDPPAQSLAFTDAHGRRLATLVSYPCHPVVLNAANRLISADFIHSLRQTVEAAHPGSVCVYATGAAGDVNTGHPAAASFRADTTRGRDAAAARRVGERIARCVLEARMTPLVADAATFRDRAVTLPFDDVDVERVRLDAAGWARERRNAPDDRRALLDSWLSWARGVHTRGAASWTGRVGCLDLGDVALVTLPGEPFLSAATQLRAAGEGRVMVLGYADGVPGYLPDAAAYPEGGYEVDDAHRYYGMPARFARGGLERLVDAARGLLAHEGG